MLNQQNLNQKQKGYHRDRKILQAIEEYHALDRAQVQCLLFPGMKSGRRKAEERLLKLHTGRKLNRHRWGDRDYVYYPDERPGMLKHLVGVNWIRIWLETGLSSWEKMHSWSYEQDYKILRCDGFGAIKNGATNKFRFLYVEMDRGTNTFDKIRKYNTLYEKETYASWWWVPLTARFPPILIVTVTAERKRLIQSEIEAHNSAGLEFQVKLLDDIREEVKERCLATNGQTESL